MARFWPPNGDQEPLGRDTAPIASDRRGSPAQRPALSKSAASPLLLFISRLGGAWPPSQGGRCEAEPTRSERGGRWGAWLRRTLAFGAVRLPAGGRRSPDRRLFRRQSSALSIHMSKNICVYLRDLRFLRWADGLCVFVPSCLRWTLCFLCVSVPLWLRRPPDGVSKTEIRATVLDFTPEPILRWEMQPCTNAHVGQAHERRRQTQPLRPQDRASGTVE